MTTFRRMLIGWVFVSAITSLASADEIGFTTTYSAGTGSSYTLALPEFDATLGTLTGVALYFQADETASTFSVQNTGLTSQTFEMDVTSNLVSGFTNSATAADKFTNENVTVFDTGGGNDTNPFAGGCIDDPTTAVKTSCGGNVTLAGGATADFSPVNISNVDASYSTANNSVFGITTGTGYLGTVGAYKAGTNISNYIGATSFTLAGGISGGTSYYITGTNNEQLTQVTTSNYIAEVDYTYTPFSTTPEPTTLALMGGALIGLGLLGKRFKKN